ncbi:actinidain-like isoform X2 [Hordeum vulgare subsp. vulgare]|uniref:actinidain-like isoform X2 n=1 Tax=Hordeum vulgare subsp. vulgare TaxID=112509 RepID=UPI001D1A37B7|nr:actinidain-like isoform X2 [Hordeum vulgare subsp. vulgare]
MSPLRFFGSLIAARLSSCRVGCQALGSARLLHKLPIGESHGSAVTVGALSVLMGGMWYFKEDAEKPAALKQIHHEEALEEETIEEKAMKKRFEDWMIKYGCMYQDKEEKAMRYELFKLTAKHVDENNAMPGTLCTLGTNQFADRTEEEFSWSCGGPRSTVSGKEIMRRGYL